MEFIIDAISQTPRKELWQDISINSVLEECLKLLKESEDQKTYVVCSYSNRQKQ